jgi:hypothetical protein
MPCYSLEIWRRQLSAQLQKLLEFDYLDLKRNTRTSVERSATRCAGSGKTRVYTALEVQNRLACNKRYAKKLNVSPKDKISRSLNSILGYQPRYLLETSVVRLNQQFLDKDTAFSDLRDGLRRNSFSSVWNIYQQGMQKPFATTRVKRISQEFS